MNKNSKILLWVVIAVIVIGGGYWLMNQNGSGNGGGSADSGAGPIKVGFLGPLTGDAAVYGISENRAMQIAIEEINAQGGVGGRMFELVTEDGKCDPQVGGTVAQKLVNIDKLQLIVGGACSGETLAAAAVTEPAKVIVISPSASSPKITTAGDYVFRTYPSDALAGKVAATYDYKELKAAKAAVISELTDYAQGLREVYKKTFTGLGGTIVADETYTTGDTDFRTQILKVRTANPDVIYVVPQSPTPGVAIFKQLRENGVKVAYQTAEVLLDRKTDKENAAVLEGVLGVESGVDYVNNAKAKAFAAAHQAKFKEEPGIFAANAYDAMYLLRDAIAANGGKVDTAKVRDFLYKVKDWDGAVGKLTMDANGDPLLGLNVRKIVKGEVTDLGAYTP